MANALDKAIALEYGKHAAPVVTATGQGGLATQIVAEAQAQGVPVMRDPELAARLANLPLGATIPREVYVAVAVVLSWVYWMEGRAPSALDADSGPL
jgi:flagellar biosynthesis protein